MSDPTRQPVGSSPRSASSLLRVWLGIAPLAAYAAFHAWVSYPALYSADAWLERAGRFRLGPAGWSLALVLLAAHIVTSAVDLVRRRRARAQGPARSPDPWLGLEAFLLVLFTAFVTHHVASLGVRVTDTAPAALAAYDVLWTTLGTWFEVIAYALGITALAFHVGLGLARALDALLGMPRGSRYAAGLVAFLLWLAFAQVLGRFATGESLVPALVVGASSGGDGGAP